LAQRSRNAGAQPIERMSITASKLAAAVVPGHAATLRAVATRLQAIACPYEAALALADAGDLDPAYRMLRAYGATTARAQVAARMRTAGRPIPRRARIPIEGGGLTETERSVCRLVAAGATNHAIAIQLNIGPRTVEWHLTRIYQRTGRRGRTALATWWTQQEAADGNGAPAAG